MAERIGRILALLAAIVAWAALVLQLALIIDKMTADGASTAAAVWRFFGFFTILTNIAVAVVSTAMIVKPSSLLARPLARLSTAAAIAIVGIVYSVALREFWEPTGWQAVADHALHDATPPLFVLAWLLSRHGGLGWGDALRALVPPAGYFAYAMVRGAADGWYAYWFLNPTTQSREAIVASVAVLLCGFLVTSAIFVAIDRLLARRSGRAIARPATP